MDLPEQAQGGGHVLPQKGTGWTVSEERRQQLVSLLIGPLSGSQIVLVPKNRGQVIQRSGQDAPRLKVGGGAFRGVAQDRDGLLELGLGDHTVPAVS